MLHGPILWMPCLLIQGDRWLFATYLESGRSLARLVMNLFYFEVCVRYFKVVFLWLLDFRRHWNLSPFNFCKPCWINLRYVSCLFLLALLSLSTLGLYLWTFLSAWHYVQERGEAQRARLEVLQLQSRLSARFVPLELEISRFVHAALHCLLFLVPPLSWCNLRQSSCSSHCSWLFLHKTLWKTNTVELIFYE